MKVGYARVSTEEQNLHIQEDALRSAGCEEIFTDIASGSKSQRPGLDEALDYIREGDTLVVWKLDRHSVYCLYSEKRRYGSNGRTTRQWKTDNDLLPQKEMLPKSICRNALYIFACCSNC